MQFVYNRLIFFYIANSEYSAASIISLHLFGFFIGSILARYNRPTIGWLLPVFVVTTLLSYMMVWKMGVGVFGLLPALGLTVFSSFLNALFSGWVFVKILHAYEDAHNKMVAPLVAADTAGSVLGAVLSGFFFIAHLGIETTFHITMAVLAVLPVIYTLAHGGSPENTRNKAQDKTNRLYRIGAVTSVVVILAGVAVLSVVDMTPAVRKVAGYPLAEAQAEAGEVIFSKRSPHGNLIVTKGKIPPSRPEEEAANNVVLWIDSRVLCAAWDSDKFEGDSSEWKIGSDAGYLKPHGRLAIIGLGCGISLSSALEYTKEDAIIDTIEINPMMQQATVQFQEMAGFKLDDPRHNLIIEDGFRYFQDYKGPQYDAIILDVAWMQNINSTHLFSVEMFENIKRALKPDGGFIIWTEERDPFSQVSLITMRSLEQVFNHVHLEVYGGSVLFYVSDHRPVFVEEEGYVSKEGQILTPWAKRQAREAPLNTLDDLAMNRSKFTWFGDTKFDRLFEQYDTKVPEQEYSDYK